MLSYPANTTKPSRVLPGILWMTEGVPVLCLHLLHSGFRCGNSVIDGRWHSYFYFQDLIVGRRYEPPSIDVVCGITWERQQDFRNKSCAWSVTYDPANILSLRQAIQVPTLIVAMETVLVLDWDEQEDAPLLGPNYAIRTHPNKELVHLRHMQLLPEQLPQRVKFRQAYLPAR